MTTRKSPLDHERREEFAARLIVEAHTGHTLQLIDDGSANGLVDYHLCGPSEGPIGALEVGRNTLPASRKTDDAYKKYGAEPQRIADLTRTWSVFCEGDNTRFNRLVDQLAPLLRELEAAGRTDIDAHGAHPYFGNHLSVEWRLRELGVQHASSYATRGEAPFVAVTSYRGWRSTMSADVTLAEAEAWLSSENSDQRGARRKLMATGLPDRHMFLWVDTHNMQASRMLSEPELPTRHPELPQEVTHLWLASDSGYKGLGGWHWSLDTGWSSLADVESSVVHAATAFASNPH